MTSKPAEKPLAYLILGASGSGRREVLADLLEAGLSAEDRPAVLLPEGEPSDAADARLGAVSRWRLDRNKAIEADAPPNANRLFFVADGRRNPVDQIEAFKVWLGVIGAELGRILCVVNCQLAEKNPRLLAWYDACIHFSDVVLLNRREGVANKWISDYKARFADQFFPCLIEFVRSGRVSNPALILDPQARRLSQFFDEAEEEVPIEEDPEELGTEEETGIPSGEDPFIARWASGRRIKEIPDVARFLGPPEKRD